MKLTSKLVFAGLMAFFIFAAFAPATLSADWIMFHADERNTGVGTGDISGPPRLIWNYTAEGPITAYSPVVANGILYSCSGDQNLHAFNASTGEKIWNYSFNTGCSWSPAIDNGVLYIGCYDSNFYALDALTGAKIWNYSVSTLGIVCSSPTVSDGVVYAGYGQMLFPEENGALIALNCTTGSKIWNYSVSSLVLTVPAVADGIVYAGTYGRGINENGVFAVNSTTGTLLWAFQDPYAVCTTSSPAVSNGLVYIGSYGGALIGKIFALDAKSGGAVWSHELINRTSSSPAVANNIVYIGSENGSVHAFNALTGTQIWTYKTGGGINSSPAVSNDVVCIGSEDGNLYAFNATTGVNLWKFAADERILSSPAISDGKIYFLSDDTTYSSPSYSRNSTIYALYATPLIESDLAVSCISSTSYNSFHVNINGILTANDIGTSASPIQISCSNNGGATWYSLTQAITDSEGKFTIEWFPSVSGNYIIDATFNGNLTHSTTSAIVNLAVMPYQSENANFVFSVVSNSTLTDLAFDSTSKQLTFAVSGQSGTMGYTDISIPKSLISDIAGLTISIDNNQATYTSVSEQDAWLIHFSYQHSTHLVTISLETQQNPDPTPTPTTSPTSAPAATSNQQSSTPSRTQTPAQTASPSVTPAIPETQILVILPLFALISLIATVIMRKNRNQISQLIEAK